MIMPGWDKLPDSMRNERVRKYYDMLCKKQTSLIIKRTFDIAVSFLLLILLCPVFVCIAILIKRDSKGPVIFSQTRVTSFDRDFTIYKFRSMVERAPELGSEVTVANDMRITKIGAILRKYRLDELPQLVNVLKGDMSFVGTRPEVRKYVDAYSPEMMATLLMPAGITSVASIKYKDEDRLLENADDADLVYIKRILPDKMRYNLRSLKRFSLIGDLCTMARTVLEVLM